MIALLVRAAAPDTPDEAAARLLADSGLDLFDWPTCALRLEQAGIEPADLSEPFEEIVQHAELARLLRTLQ